MDENRREKTKRTKHLIKRFFVGCCLSFIGILLLKISIPFDMAFWQWMGFFLGLTLLATPLNGEVGN